MGQDTQISWARHTFNAWIGCTKISPACVNCYAERDWDHRFHRVQWGPKGDRVLTSDENWKKPLAWDRAAAAAGERHSVFCNSLSDVFDDHPSIKFEWRMRLWDLIVRCQNLDWLMLTKRPENWPYLLPVAEPRPPFQNIRLGVSIEDQERCEDRAPKLCFASMIGWQTFVSYEPACGSVDWTRLLETGAVDWLICGGESGPKARPSHPDLFRLARDAAEQHGVPFHFKQWGEWCDPVAAGIPVAQGDEYITAEDGCRLFRVGRERSGRMLDGKLHNEFPRVVN